MINQEQRPALRMQLPTRTDTFTLTFPGGQIAVLLVCNAPSHVHALVHAANVLPCRYTVADGDRSQGQANVFYTWWYQDEDQQGGQQ